MDQIMKGSQLVGGDERQVGILRIMRIFVMFKFELDYQIVDNFMCSHTDPQLLQVGECPTAHFVAIRFFGVAAEQCCSDAVY